MSFAGIPDDGTFGGMPMAAPSWSIMKDEAAKQLGYLRVILAGQPLLPEQHEEFFSNLPKIVGTACKALKDPGAQRTCVEAINLLHGWSKRTEREPFDFVDKELVGRLERILVRAANGEGIEEAIVGNFSKMTTPAFVFSKEATPDIDTSEGFSATLAMNALLDAKADSVVEKNAVKWVEER